MGDSENKASKESTGSRCSFPGKIQKDLFGRANASCNSELLALKIFPNLVSTPSQHRHVSGRRMM